MTGVEAVSNGVSAFREPVVQTARRTLAAICLILGLLLAGIAYLSHAYEIGAMDQTQFGYQSVLSQLAGAVAGRGILYFVAMGSALSVLCLSANTSFVDFPRVCRLVAEDDFLPRPFAVAGRRLVFSVGILFLSGAAALLLLVFGGITDRLIPLFAIGAFMTFTLSQFGMVMHWRHEIRNGGEDVRKHRYGVSLAINGAGAAVTATALFIIVVTKFSEGAWITLLVIPGVIFLLKIIKQYYVELDAQLREDAPLRLGSSESPVVVVVTQGWNKLTDRALEFSVGLSPDIIAVHLTSLAGPAEEENRRALRERWAKHVEEPARRRSLPAPKLVTLEARFRRMRGPLFNFIRAVEQEYPSRQIAVVIPQIVKEHWWQYLLHTHRARQLRTALLRYGGSRLIVISIPWYLEEPQLEAGLEQTESKDQRRHRMRQMLRAS